MAISICVASGCTAGWPIRKSALVLNGHHHYYDRTKSLDGITYVTSGGASHKLYGAETPDERTALFRAGANHFGLVDVYADRFDVRVLDDEGKEFDRFSVNRPEARELASGGRLAYGPD